MPATQRTRISGRGRSCCRVLAEIDASTKRPCNPPCCEIRRELHRSVLGGGHDSFLWGVKLSVRAAELHRTMESAHSFFLEKIADAVKRLDHIELDVARLELPPQPLDVRIDSSVIHVHLSVIGRIHQFVAALHHPGPACQ
jgi:hypothetical protein